MNQIFLPQPDSPSVRPRALVHRGVVAARGFWFTRGLVPEDVARRRILMLWQSGAKVERFPDGLLLRLPLPVSTRAENAVGTPLQARKTAQAATSQEALAAAPFSNDEWRSLASPSGSVVVVVQGEARFLTGGEAEDPSLWLDCGEFICAATQSLGVAPEVEMVLSTPDFDIRQKLAGIPPADSQLAEVIAAIRRSREGESREIANGANHRDAAGTKFGVFLLGAIGFLSRPFLPARTHSGAAGEGSRSSAAKEGTDRPNSEDASHDFLRHLLARMAMMLRLGNVIGRRQAQYIARMMRMFEDGQWEEALRHAVPLAGDSSYEPPMALGALRPRDSISISPALARAGSSLNFGPEVHERLQALYRRAFEQLKERNRIDEAAFVLAELLGASEEAVAFLEANGNLRLAAEMAEARDLPPGLVVRQWFIAGDRARAVLFARRSGSFADAVARLEQGAHREEAAALRVLWGGSLAREGAFNAAVEAVWPVESARPLAREWLEQGVALGGVAAARLLARFVALDPQARPRWQPQIEELLEDEGVEDAPARLAFSRTLARGESDDERAASRIMARAAVRSLARDTASGAVRGDAREYRRLLDLASDAALRADAPGLPAAPPVKDDSSGQILFEFRADDSTGLAISDAALLPDGSCVAALGESGVRLLARDGRTRALLPQPAHRLVLAESGSRALALARRGEAIRISHLDFASRAATHWGEAALTLETETYDGSQWIAAAGAELLALDTHAPAPSALWKSGDTSGQIETLACSLEEVSMLIYSSGTTDAWGGPCDPWEKREIWRLGGTPLVLRERRAAPLLLPNIVEPQSALSPDGKLLVAAQQELEAQTVDAAFPTREADAGKPIVLIHQHRTVMLGEKSIGQKPFAPVARGAWIAVGTRDENGAYCYLLDEKMLQLRAIFSLRGATQLAIRLQGDDLVLCDDRGRLLVFHCASRTLRRDLRLT